MCLSFFLEVRTDKHLWELFKKRIFNMRELFRISGKIAIFYGKKIKNPNMNNQSNIQGLFREFGVLNTRNN